MTEHFGFETRETKRNEKSIAIKAKAKAICERELDINQITLSNYLSYYKKVDEALIDSFPVVKSYQLARLEFLKYIRRLNQVYRLNLPEPDIPYIAYRSPLVLSPQLFYKGTSVYETVAVVKQHWKRQSLFDLKTSLAWCLYSAILFGGISHDAHLKAFIAAIKQQKTPFRIVHDQLLLCLQINDTSYGHTLHDTGKHSVRDYHVVIDDVTALWMIRLYKLAKAEPSTCLADISVNDIKKTLFRELNSLGFAFSSLKALYEHGSFHALFQPNSAYDVTMMQIQKHPHTHWSTSLSEHALVNYFQPTLRKHPLTLSRERIYQLNIQSKTPKQHQVRQPAIHRDVMKGLKFYIKAGDTKKLVTLHEYFPQPNHTRLISWAVEQSQTTNKPETTLRYLSEFAEDWLSLTYDETFSDLCAEEYLAIYEQIIHDKAFDRQHYTAMRLRQFHTHQVKTYGAPTLQFARHKQIYICRAQMLSPMVYQRMLTSLQNCDDFKNYTFEKKQCLSLLILAYRTGMRINELVGLQTHDFDLTKFMEVTIRPNHHRKLKTDSAKRRLPLWALLTPSEKNIVDDYITGQRNAKMTYAFSTGAADVPLADHVPRQLLRELLNAHLEEHNITFHGLRHTALSQLAIALFADEKTFTWFAGAHNTRWQHIRFALLGKTDAHQVGQHRWMVLTAFAGHLKTDVTLKHYLHTAHLLAGIAITQLDEQISGGAILNITELSRRRISQRMKDEYRRHIKQHQTPDIARETKPTRFTPDLEIHLKALRPLASYILSDHQHELYSETSESEQTHALLEQPNHGQMDSMANSLLKGYSLTHILRCLEYIEQGETIENAAFHSNIHYQHAKRWYQNALAVKEVTNNHGKSRLFSHDRADKILPAKPHHHDALKLIDKFINNAVMLYASEPNKLTDFLETFLKKSTTSKSTIRFPKKSADHLHQFLLVGFTLLPSHHWRLFAPTLVSGRDLKKDLSLPIKLSITTHNDYAGFAIGIAQTKKQKTLDLRERQQSFGVLKYACHVLLILLDRTSKPCTRNLANTTSTD